MEDPIYALRRRSDGWWAYQTKSFWGKWKLEFSSELLVHRPGALRFMPQHDVPNCDVVKFELGEVRYQSGPYIPTRVRMADTLSRWIKGLQIESDYIDPTEDIPEIGQRAVPGSQTAGPQATKTVPETIYKELVSALTECIYYTSGPVTKRLLKTHETLAKAEKLNEEGE